MRYFLFACAIALTACDDLPVPVAQDDVAADAVGGDAAAGTDGQIAGVDAADVGPDSADAADAADGSDAQADADVQAGVDAADVPVDADAQSGTDADTGTDAEAGTDVQLQPDTPDAAEVADAADVPEPDAGPDVPLEDVATQPDNVVGDTGPDAPPGPDVVADPDVAPGPDVPDDAGPPKPDLYDPDYMPKFELVVDDAAMAVLMDPSDASKKTWVHAAFTCEGETLGDVGLRRKGETTYRVVPKKAAFKVQFNKWQKGLKFRGYKQLTLNNMVDDPTALRERLAYAFYNKLNMPAPKCNTALVTLNGESYGPYANVETPDSQFLKDRFGNNANTLYEVDWGSEWQPGNEDGFLVDVGDPGKADLLAFFDAVAATVDATLLADIKNNLDIEQWLTFSAIEAVLAEHDNYAYGVWGSHNYYLAGGKDGLFRLLPWSVDLSFGDDDGGVNAAEPRPSDPTVGGDTLLMRCQKTASCWDVYKTHVSSVLTAYQAADLVTLAKKWHAQVDAEQTADTKRESSLEFYAESIDMLYAWIPARVGIVKGQLGLP